MKSQLRKIARAAAGWPVVGRFVRIGVAVIRLPETRDAHGRFEAEVLQRLVGPRGAEPAGATFATEQLPSLLQSLSDLNQRMIAADNDQLNLVNSVPLALRKLTRDLVEVRDQCSQVLPTVEQRLNTDAADIDRRLKELGGVLADMQAGLLAEGVEQRIVTLNRQVAGLADSIAYLLGRVEFVRREVMFEMRYGASAPSGEGEQLQAKTEILDPQKVEAARAGGLKLNLGCGHIPLDGYLNVDRRALPGVDIVAEVDNLPFGKGELSEICSAHLLEHFPEEQMRRELLPYWVSLLRPDGTFRAIVPDGKGMTQAFASSEYSFETLRRVTFGGQDYDGDFHFNMFSPESLTQILNEAGLSQVEIVAENRENGGCKEFEVIARR